MLAHAACAASEEKHLLGRKVVCLGGSPACQCALQTRRMVRGVGGSQIVARGDGVTKTTPVAKAVAAIAAGPVPSSAASRTSIIAEKYDISRG